MASDRICAIDGCCKHVIARDLCTMHYQRLRATGDPRADVAPRGEKLRWIRDASAAEHGDDCLVWPFRRRGDGYADLQVDGRKVLAHRLMCEAANGAPPTPKHDAAHSCGNGHGGCVNPRHLRWDTRAGNMADMVAHGTRLRGARSPNAKLNEDDVREIRRLASTTSYRKIAASFGISANTARLIAVGQRWGWLQ